MNVLNQILDGASFGFLVFALSAAAASVYFTVMFFKSRTALRKKEDVSDTERKEHRIKRRRMIILLVVFGLMLDFTLSAFILRGAAGEYGYLANPISTVSKKDGTLKISPLKSYKTNADGSTEPAVKSGSLKNGKAKTFSFTAEGTGTYLFRFTKMSDGMEIKLNLRDSGGNNVDYAGGVRSKSEVPMDNVEKGVRYTVTLTAVKGEGEYEIEMIPPKNFDIKHYTAIKDSVEYSFQSNAYFFTPLTDGVYCFSLTGVKESCKIGIGVPDAEETVYIDNCSVTVSLYAGKTYRINVNQMKGFSGYTLNVQRQKKTQDISDFSVVTDSFEFIGQQNVYKLSGKSKLTLSFEMNGTYTAVFLLNEQENIVYSMESLRGYKTVNISKLHPDEEYLLVLVSLENNGTYKFYVE